MKKDIKIEGNRKVNQSKRYNNGLKNKINIKDVHSKYIPKILILATYPPRECGIATYTYDLKNALDNKFEKCFEIKICALESQSESHTYKEKDVDMVVNTNDLNAFSNVTSEINSNEAIELVMIQHEFGLFKSNEAAFTKFLKSLNKPIIIAFHTVLPHPNKDLEKLVKELASIAKSITVMTQASVDLLEKTYGVSPNKIELISHGTHLVKHQDKTILKEKYHVSNRKIISTFGFLGPGKSIETTLDALPAIIKEHPEILFLIVGKTHPTLFNQEGNAYMDFLKEKVTTLELTDYVQFVNKFVPLPELLEYLQLSDCYVFTSKDPNQAVSGTFSYAVSCGCPIVSTPIPHATEVLNSGNGLLFDFGNSIQLSQNVNNLLNDNKLKQGMRMKGLHSSSATSWQNAAIAHGHIFSNHMITPIKLKYKKPEINLNHIKSMTPEVGIVQFSKINTLDLESGYTLDDNARALIAICEYYKISKNPEDLKLIKLYTNFILKCQRDNGLFFNYVDKNKKFTSQNNQENLEDSNGRAIWALGYTYYLMDEGFDLEITLLQNVKCAINQFKMNFNSFKSPRALAFAIKGWYFFNLKMNDESIDTIIKDAGNKLLELYNAHNEKDWLWFEPYLTYANSVLPESLLYAWKGTGDLKFKDIAKESFDFLISKIFTDNAIKVISNQNWLMKDLKKQTENVGGEQPIDVAYTILALKQFNKFFPFEGYDEKMEIAFSWFQGNNELKQIVYNPCTGGCHDGLEAHNVNLNQGAESTISYLLARLAFEID